MDVGYPKAIGRWWSACSPTGRLEAPPAAPTDMEALSGGADFDDFQTVGGDGDTTGGATTASGPPALLAFSTAVVMVLRKLA